MTLREAKEDLHEEVYIYVPPTEWNISRTREVSSQTMKRRPRVSTAASPKKAAPLDVSRSACGRTTPCAWRPRSKCKELRFSSLFSTMQKPGSSTGNSWSCWSGLTQRCLRSIMGIHWQDYVTNEILKRAQHPQALNQCWCSDSFDGWVISHAWDNSRMPKAIFYGELRQGRRDRGAPP